MLEKNAATKPDKIAVSDFADRADWTSGGPRQLTYAELDAKVETLAAFFAGLGLSPDSVIAVQLPATTDAVVVFFAALRAGLVVAPLPLAWREAEILDGLTQIGAKAIVDGRKCRWRADGRAPARRGGRIVPHPLRVRAQVDPCPMDSSISTASSRNGRASARRPTSFARAMPPTTQQPSPGAWPPPGGAPRPLAKSHNHWIATGLMTLLEARVDQSAVVVLPFALSSIMAIGGGLLPWLLACGTLVLGLPASIEVLAETAVENKATHVLAPQRFARRLAERLDMHRASPMLLVAGADRPVETTMPRGFRIIDLTAIGEVGLIARKRVDHSTRQALPIGVVGSPSETDFAPLLVETRVKAVPQRAGDTVRGAAATGEVTVRGPMVPEFIWGAGGRPQAVGDTDEWTLSGISVQVVSVQPPLFELRGPAGDISGAGALAIDLKALDALYQSVETVIDAAAVPYPDATSARIAAVVVPRPGEAFDHAAYMAAIEAMRLGSHKVPVEVFPVPSIARSATERVMRAGMATRLASLQPDIAK